MSEWFFWILALAIPATIGVSPALLPARLPWWVRWALALLLLGISIWFYLTGGDPHPYHLVFLAPFWLGWVLGAIIMMPWPVPEPTER